MKCVLCDGKLEEKRVDYQEFGVSLGKFKGLTCTKCAETFFDPETADKIEKQFAGPKIKSGSSLFPRL